MTEYQRTTRFYIDFFAVNFEVIIMLMRMCQKRRDANDIFLGKYLLLPDDLLKLNRFWNPKSQPNRSPQSDPETLCSHCPSWFVCCINWQQLYLTFHPSFLYLLVNNDLISHKWSVRSTLFSKKSNKSFPFFTCEISKRDITNIAEQRTDLMNQHWCLASAKGIAIMIVGVEAGCILGRSSSLLLCCQPTFLVN